MLKWENLTTAVIRYLNVCWVCALREIESAFGHLWFRNKCDFQEIELHNFPVDQPQ